MGLIQAFSPTMMSYMISRLFFGAASYGRFLNGYVLIMEWVGPKLRGDAAVYHAAPAHHLPQPAGGDRGFYAARGVPAPTSGRRLHSGDGDDGARSSRHAAGHAAASRWSELRLRRREPQPQPRQAVRLPGQPGNRRASWCSEHPACLRFRWNWSATVRTRQRIARIQALVIA